MQTYRSKQYCDKSYLNILQNYFSVQKTRLNLKAKYTLAYLYTNKELLAEYTNLLYKGKYHYEANLLFPWFGFNQPVDNFNITKMLNANQ